MYYFQVLIIEGKLFGIISRIVLQCNKVEYISAYYHSDNLRNRSKRTQSYHIMHYTWAHSA